jgi:hypothetical protein
MATFYFNGADDIANSVDPPLWSNLGNWWMNSGFTVPATALPTSSDSVVASVRIDTDGPREVVNATVDGSGTAMSGELTVTGLCTFNNSSYNNATITGNATFNNSSTNRNTVSGNATFTYLTATNGNVVDVTGYANGIVGGLTKDSAGNTITSWTFDTTNNNGTVSGDCIFNANSGNYGTITGNCTFNEESYNYDTITGDCTFNDYSWNGSGGNITGYCTFNDYSYQMDTIDGNCTFNHNSQNSLSGNTGNATFNDSSYNDGTIGGDTTFNDSSYNNGTVNGGRYFSNRTPYPIPRGINGSSILGVI